MASVAKCWRQTFAGRCTLSEYFPSSLYFTFINTSFIHTSISFRACCKLRFSASSSSCFDCFISCYIIAQINRQSSTFAIISHLAGLHSFDISSDDPADSGFRFIPNGIPRGKRKKFPRRLHWIPSEILPGFFQKTSFRVHWIPCEIFYGIFMSPEENI